MDGHRVTVLIGAFNSSATLGRASRSILEQTVSDLELVIVDDGSHDRTAEVATDLAREDSRVRLLRIRENVGIARSLNEGLRAATAPVVAILDADDWSEPKRLERQLEVLDQRPEVAVVGCRMREVDELGRELRPRTRFQTGEVNNVLMHFNPIPNSCAAIRRTAALDAGGYDARYRWAAEYDLWLRLAERYRLIALDETLATRQMSSTNVAATRERQQTAEAIVMRVRAMQRRRTLSGAGGLLPYAASYLTPMPLKRALRRARNQAP